MEGVEETPAATASNPEADLGASTSVAPGKDEMPPTKPPLTSPQGDEKIGDDALQQGDGKEKEATKKNLALCGTVAVRPRLEPNDGWQPPQVTHEFGYPSDEEIVPNPKADFKKAFLPRLGHVRSWFKGTDTEAKANASTREEGARSTAPCLPIMAGKGSLSDGDSGYHPNISPRLYTDITSRLPRDPDELLQVASRPGAKTRLRSVALRSVTDRSTKEEGIDNYADDEESFSDSSSTSSLEKLTNSPPYHELAPSVLSECEDGLEDLHTAPAHMAVDGGKNDGSASAQASAAAGREAALEEEMKEQR